MKKRVISIVLTVALILSIATVGFMSVSAAEQNADESSANGVIYFSIPDFWMDEFGFVPGSTSVFCHVFQIGNLDPDFQEYAWQTRGETCTYDAATGKYVYDFGAALFERGRVDFAINLKDDADYGVIFSAKNLQGNQKETQTYDLTMGTDCYGDSVYVENKLYENIMDSSKQTYASYWTSAANAEKYGPHAGITSLGVLQGEKYAPHEDKVLAVANFIKDYNANIPTNEDPQVCITLCNKLGVEPYDAYEKYATTYADLIAAGTIPNLETVAGYLGLSYPPIPPTTEPVTTEPVTTEPVTTEPVTTEPVTTEPVTTEPVTTEPVTTEPVTTVPIGDQLGDVNKDGEVNVIDASLMQLVLAKLEVKDSVFDQRLTDYNQDGSFNILDATYVQLFSAGLLEGIPVLPTA